MKIPVGEITIGERFRKNIDSAKVEQLAESIREIGLQQPVRITTDKRLVFGMHRLEAVKLNGDTEIECNICSIDDEKEPLKIELAEIDENLMRNELHYLDRGLHLARRKEIYEQLYPGRTAENSGSLKASGEIISYQPKPFTEDVASRLNVSQRTVQGEIQIAKNLIPQMQQIVVEKDVGKVDALKLARMPPEEQKKIADRISIGGAGTVRTAIAELKREGTLDIPGEKPSREAELGMGEDLRDFLQTARVLSRQLPMLFESDVAAAQREYVCECLEKLYAELKEVMSKIHSQ
ncbi:ParB/RepB/Spo0J family partition protein [Anaerobacterium chartisolvens]|uniref:ParB/RepB/Spo0J family partition protein n=1 Tax=Anaerobacterium chartisolvens TaxID=1297424 RepID=UPI001FA8BA1D|nr:ParB N-terminal domain-containing protein [Anaerobacterium chartisolvens]